MRLRALLLLLLPVSTAVGCASGSGPASDHGLDPAEMEEFYLVDHVVSGTPCAVGPPTDDELAEPSAVVDVEALTRKLESSDRTPGHVIFSVRFDDGAVERFAVIASSLERSMEQELKAAAEEHLRPGREPHWQGRLRLDVGPSPRVRLGHQTWCDPELANRAEVARVVTELFSELPQSAFEPCSPREGRCAEEMRGLVGKYFIGRDGRVERSTLGRSSGDPRVDRIVDEIASVLRFEPAVIDGIPIPVWVSLPIHALTPLGGQSR